MAIVGAGLAGIAAAYQLHRVGIRSQIFEARGRIGGRCWTARGFADGQVAEHGGEFIDSRHVHIRQLVRQLGLELDDLWSARYGSFSPLWADGGRVRHRDLKAAMDMISDAAAAEAKRLGVLRANGSVTTAPLSYGTASPAAVQLDQLTMAEWLEAHVPGVLGTAVGKIIDELMGSWYGANLDRLSAVNWIDFFVIPYPGGDERWHVHGGNDLVTTRAAATLPAGSIHRETVLRAIRRRGSRYELTFDGHRPVVADFVILTLPFTTLRDVDYAGAGFSAHKRAAIEQLAMGDDSKVLIQYDRRPWRMSDWSASLESVDPDFDTWESSAAQPGTAGLITAYGGGRTARAWSAPDPHGPAPAALRDAGAAPHRPGRARHPQALQRPRVGRPVAARSVDEGLVRGVRPRRSTRGSGRAPGGPRATSTSPARRRPRTARDSSTAASRAATVRRSRSCASCGCACRHRSRTCPTPGSAASGLLRTGRCAYSVCVMRWFALPTAGVLGGVTLYEAALAAGVIGYTGVRHPPLWASTTVLGGCLVMVVAGIVIAWVVMLDAVVILEGAAARMASMWSIAVIPCIAAAAVFARWLTPDPYYLPSTFRRLSEAESSARR